MDFHESSCNQPVVERLEFRQGDRLYLNNGVYEVERKLGKGGFGSVYSVKNGQGTKALKVLHLWEILKNEHQLLKQRFDIEFSIGKVRSDYLVNTFAKGCIGGNPYITMEYCPNGNLYEKHTEYKDEVDYEDIVFRLLSGLEDLHAHDIIHRDIKPENLIFDTNKKLKITDFGISAYLNNRRTERGIFGNAKQAFGSVLYSPPEQLVASKAYKFTKSTMDIYAVGVTLYFMFSDGLFPFGSFQDYEKDVDAYMDRKKSKLYNPISHIKPYLDPKWTYVIDKCLQPDPNQRFQTIVELKAALNLQSSKRSGTTEWFNNNTIKITGGEQQGVVIDLDELMLSKNKRLLTLGRHGTTHTNDVALKESYTSYISTRHATLEYNNNEWYIRDGQFVKDNNGPRWKNSTNGTMINEHEICKLDSYKLSHGDSIRVGEFMLKYYRAMQR